MSTSLSEQTVHVEAKSSDNGVLSADHDRIRSALYDLSSKETPTHTVVLPHGTMIRNKTPLGRSLALYKPHFTIGQGGEEKVAVGIESAANLARTMDTLAMSPDEQRRFGEMRESEEQEPVAEAEEATTPPPSSPSVPWSGGIFAR